MSVHVGWDTTRAGVVRCDFISVQQATEYEQALETIKILASEKPAQKLKIVIVIVVVSSEDLPQVSVLRFMRALVDVLDALVECIVIVTQDPLLDVLIHLIQPFYQHFGIRLSNTPDVQQALTYIDQNFSPI